MEDRSPWKWSIEPPKGSGSKVVAVLTAVKDYMLVARERMKRWAPQHQEANQLHQGGNQRATNKSRMQTKRARENDEGVQDKAGEVEWYSMSTGELNRKLDRDGVAPVRFGARSWQAMGGQPMKGADSITIYWQDVKGMTTTAMQGWWKELGAPEQWYLGNAGERTVTYGDKELQVGEVRLMKGQPGTGWQDGTGAKGRVFVALEGRGKDSKKLKLGTINLQGFGH